MPFRAGMLSFIGLLAGCIPVLPPVSPGFIGTAPRSGGSVDFGLQGAAAGVCGSSCIPIGGGVVRLEPYAGRTASFPLEVAVGADGHNGIYIPTRIGFRQRLESGLVLGLGGGPSFSVGEAYEPDLVGGAFDVEIGGGAEGPRGGWSLAARPGMIIASYGNESTWGFAVPIEVAGVSFVSDHIGLGGSAFGGFEYTQQSWLGAFGATVTLVVRGDPDATAR